MTDPTYADAEPKYQYCISRSALAREIHADHPTWTIAELMMHTGLTRGAVHRALAYVPSGVRRGPKGKAKCERCGGTGRA